MDRKAASIAEWLEWIHDHGVKTRHLNFGWNDVVLFDWGLRCLTCDIRFLISEQTVKADPSNRARLFESGMRVFAGRDALLETIVKSIKASMPVRTAWSAVLEDDEEQTDAEIRVLGDGSGSQEGGSSNAR
jgi:hypothetical protein